MARTKLDPQVLAHLEWLGFVKPTGLVVSAPALVRAGAILDRRDAEGQRLLRSCLDSGDDTPRHSKTPPGQTPSSDPCLTDFRAFAQTVLGWSFSPKGYAGTDDNPIPPELEVPLTDYGETLRPDFAVREPDPKEGGSRWQLLVRVLEPGEDIDRVVRAGGRLEASAHGRMERLLRSTGVAAGLIVSGHALRLVSAPHGESSGWLDFLVADMVQTAGRPISTALRLLLGQERLLALPRAQRLAALLEDSRKFQNEVSERLANQVLDALYELLRGFQSAHDASRANRTDGNELLRRPLTEHPDEVYRALLTVILRLVFLLYAEERDMLPKDETFLRFYSLAGLYDRLREDASIFPDTMDQRFGAWAQLLVLFRMLHDGAEAGELRLPKRHGVLFDPDRFPFLEGRTGRGPRQSHERIAPPLVPDGTVYRALEKLLVLDGERLSYRALDVEQIGSVYETMMGFRLETATGRSVAIKAPKKHGAPTAVDLDELIGVPASKREKWLRDRTERKLTDKVKRAVKDAAHLEDLHAALQPVIDQGATPDLVAPGAMLLQPSDERRRSGSHYTPRALTEPIVRTTLEPILARLRGADESNKGESEANRPPRPADLLELKVCDPAMGSGAFLVEACRQLGDALVESWHAWGELPEIPPDEDEVGFARRLIAQRCLYGVDRNPVAVDLAKVSLWLVTLAKDHALTFVDHALRHGDSLVGLSRLQIEVFHWDTSQIWESPARAKMREQLIRVADLRKRIREAGEDTSDGERRGYWHETQSELAEVRLFGDLVLAAFFDGAKPKERAAIREKFRKAVTRAEASSYVGWLEERRHADPPLAPFHWEIEFPEVFERENAGFDVLVGNPPFAGKNSVAAANAAGYPDWLKEMHPGSHGNSDVVAHFFRRVFDLLRQDGTLGMIATNTIGQGDTRSTGLRWICEHGGTIYHASKRVKWPGPAAVVVSVLHVQKGNFAGPKRLDNREVETITAFLFHRGGNDDPAPLAANARKSFVGSYVLGMGFTFDDTDARGIATSLAEMRRLIETGPRNQEVIFPYIGGEEVNTSPTHAHHRYVINFGERSEAECRERWPELMAIIEEKVQPERMKLRNTPDGKRLKATWWQFGRTRPELQAAIAGLERVLAVARVGQQASFTFLPAGTVFSEQLIVFPLTTHAAFCALQSRPHEIWARFFGSSMKDDLRYTPSDCFDTFPFPQDWEAHPALEAAGRACHQFRARLMIQNDEGLTRTYNRFHDPDERDPEIEQLRKLHAAMDRAVLDAYGWTDLTPNCEFLLDYEIDEETWSPRRKKPWRYRWPAEAHDEVLARLLELNAKRARAEARSGVAATKKRRGKKTAKREPNGPQTGDLFP